MKRRAMILVTLAAIMLPGVALAQSFQDRLVAKLGAEGYTSINVSRTWLGRTRIRARSPDYRREIVFDPRTGEILRDFWEVIGAAGSSASGLFDDDDDDDRKKSSASGSSNKSSSNSDSGEDDDDDRDDDEDDDKDVDDDRDDNDDDDDAESDDD